MLRAVGLLAAGKVCWLISTAVRTRIPWGRPMTDATTQLCEVHGEPLEVRQARIVYGLIGRSLKISPEYLAARRELFPHSDDTVLGGCIVRASKTRDRFVCPVCCEVRDTRLDLHHAGWSETHETSGL
jgi:hypothetical protein